MVVVRIELDKPWLERGLCSSFHVKPRHGFVCLEHKLWGGDRWILGVHWPVILDKEASFRFCKRFYLKRMR